MLIKSPLAQEAGALDVPPPASDITTPNETGIDSEDFEFPEIHELSEDSGVGAEDIPMLQKPSSTPVAKKEDAMAPQDKGFIDAIKDQAPAPAKESDATWIDKLKSTATSKPSAADAELESLMKSKKQTKEKTRSNASVFDISGVMLRMSLEQIEKTLQNRGYRKVSEKAEIPNFIKWRNEEFCRNQGVVGYESIQSCIIKESKKEKHQYIQAVYYIKYDTKEEVKVLFTSNFTNNKAYKIMYSSATTNISGNSPKVMYIRNIKIYDFWKKINQKYGAPDDRENVIWGLGDNKPYMQAKTGQLVLEDPMLRELDYTRMSREDQKFMNTDLYSF